MKDLLTFLLDANGRSVIKQNGVVQPVLRKVPTRNNPAGWQDIAITWERDLKDWGIIRNQTAPFTFYGDDASVLREYFYNRNIEEKLFLALTKRTLELTSTKYKWFYKYFYRAEVDPTTIKHDGPAATASLMEGDIIAKYKANKENTYEIPFADRDAIRVKMDGINLYETITYVAVDGIPVDFNDVGENFAASLSFISSEGTAFGVYKGSSNLEHSANFPATQYVPTSDNYFLKNGEDALPATFRMKGTLKVSLTKNNKGSCSLFFMKNTGVSVGSVFSFGRPAGVNITGQFSFSFDFTFTLNPGERVFFLGAMTNNFQSDFRFEFLPDSEINLTLASKYRPTFIWAFRPSTLFKRLGSKALGSESVVASQILSQSDRYCITSGDAVRGISGAVLKTKLSEFIDFCRVVLASGAGIENGTFVIEPYAHDWQTSNPVHLGKVKNLVITEAKDSFRFNALKIGYAPQDIDDINGRYEFNNTLSFSSDITRVAKELNLVCPYAAQPYLIEITRINLDGKTTTDSDTDNQPMLIDVDLENPQTDSEGIYYNLKRDPSLIITGVPDPATIFNISLSPRRLALRQQSYLDGCFFGFAGKELKFTTAERNRELKTVSTSGEVIDEDSNLGITASPLFIPKYFDFDIEAPVDLVDIMEVNPLRNFTFEREGDSTIYSGFNIKVGIAPMDHKQQAYKLLATPLNNFSKLRTNG